MDRQGIRPSLRDLADDYEQLAFPELEQQGDAPAVSVTRTRPPTILSTSTPPPIPIVPSPPAASATATDATPAAPKPKPKSRFALQREREAAERAAAAAAGTNRFQLDLDDDGNDGVTPPRQPLMPRLVGEVVERESGGAGAPPLPPSAPGPAAPSPLVGAGADSHHTGFPASAHMMFPRKPSAPFNPSASAQDDFPSQQVDPQSLPGLLASVSQDNDNVLRAMSEAEILEEQRQIRESMGLSEGVLKMLEARGRKKAEEQKARGGRRPVPEGAPVPAVREREEKEAPNGEGQEEEEGSPEYIRRHFFPDEPANANLDWMKAPSTTSSDGSTTQAFDLQGFLLPSSANSEATPAASTSHHVSSSSNFTIPSLLSLTSSSVPSQRSTSLLVLGRILAHPESNEEALGPKTWARLRLDIAQKAGYALRDHTTSVVSAAVALLAALFEEEVASARVAATLAPGAEEPATILSSFLSSTPLPAIAQHLTYPTLPASSLSQILNLLTSYLTLANPHSSSKAAPIDLLLQTPNLLESLSKRFIARSWPPSPTDAPPTPLALHFLTHLSRSSREAAQALWDRKLVEAPLRFLSVPPWELDSESGLGYELVGATLELWEILGRYGLGTNMRTKGASVLDALGERVGGFFVEERTLDEQEGNLVKRWFALLSTWTIAALDPHVTGHDVLWTHVEAWGAQGMDASRWALRRKEEGEQGVLSAAWELLTSWLEGSKVNQPWRGEKEREWVKEELGGAFEGEGVARRRVESALRRLAVTGEGGKEEEEDAALVLAALRLSSAYEEEANPPTPALFSLDSSIVDPVFARLSSTTSWTSIRLLVALLPHLDSTATRLNRTLQVLQLLRAGDEVTARDLVDWVLKTVSSPSTPELSAVTSLDSVLELPALRNASILRPFFTYAIVTSSGGRVVGPLHPTSRDLKLTASLHPFARSEPLLAEDWPLVALNELLRSGSSPVFKQLPQGWDATELQVVRSSLGLMRVVGRVRAPLLVFDLIKVFMLEKDNTTGGTTNAETDLFRDEGVQASMEALLLPLRAVSQPSAQLLLPDTRPPSSTIEGISSLMSSAPFYQLYTDLLGLYDSISLSHPIFSLMLLPALSMAYPVDFRKLVWIDYAHLLKGIRLPVEQVITDKEGEGALASYLAPRERNESVLGAYGDALVSGKVECGGFFEFVATHHVAAALFGEGESEGEGEEAVRRKLAMALVGQGSEGVVKRLVGYEQVQKEGEKLRIGEDCWVESGHGREARIGRLKVLVGEAGRGKMEQWGL